MAKKLKPLLVQQKLRDESLDVFSPREFMRAFNTPLRTAQSFINDHSGSEESLFMKLRNGVYCLQRPLPPHYVVANKLYAPSYVSLATALSHYHIIPEIVYSITSVTTKTTQEFVTPWLAFSYRKIKREAFTGYTQINEKGSVVFIAEPEKALADYLYFVDLKRMSLNDRLDVSGVAKTKVESYAKLFERKSLLKLINDVYADSRKPRIIY